MSKFKGLSIPLDEPVGEVHQVSALINENWQNFSILFLFAHGAGAGMQHIFMTSMAEAFAKLGIATLRFQFPYTEKGSRRPDHRTKLISTWKAVCQFATKEFPGFDKIVAGGKSMGGRMASQTFASPEPPAGIASLIFVGFPLHPAGKPGIDRAEHLQSVKLPMLFLQGTRDKLAELDLLKPVLKDLKSAKLHIVEGADHGFGVRKMDGRAPEEILHELAQTTLDFVRHQ